MASLSPNEVVETLLKLGVSVRDAFMDAQAHNASIDWAKFLESAPFNAIKAQVEGLIGQISGGDSVDKAIAAVDDKRGGLLAGRDVAALPSDELHAYSALLDARSLLVQTKLHELEKGGDFLKWLVESGLPILMTVGRVVIAMLVNPTAGAATAVAALTSPH